MALLRRVLKKNCSNIKYLNTKVVRFYRDDAYQAAGC